jgi:hypothetical protein
MGIAVSVVLTATIALMMAAASTSDTAVNFYQTTRRYNPDDSHLQSSTLCLIVQLRTACDGEPDFEHP